MILPPVAALIGWFTNFIAVRMIFRPRRPIGFLGLKIQGLLPKRRHEFAENIASTIEEHLFSAEDVQKAISHPDVKTDILELVRKRIDRFIEEKLIGGNPMIGAFIQGSFAEKMKASLVQEVSGLFDEGAGMIGEGLDQRLDMKKIVAEKIESFDMAKLEGIVLAVAKKELRAIELLGAVLGFIVGVVQLLLLRLLA
ncbi:MAG: DUF445 family protein [Planctomycetota bacterium]